MAINMIPSEREQLRSELISSVKKFCQQYIVPTQEQDEEHGVFRLDLYQKMGELGITGLVIPEVYGGAGLDYDLYCTVLHELSKYSTSYAVTLSVSTMVQSIILQFGTEEQRKTYLPALASGQEIGAFSLSESHAGSDAASLKTTAKKQGDCYILQGQKMWVTSGGVASTYIVMARTSSTDLGAKGVSAFIVKKDQPGFQFGKLEKKMGWKVSPTRELLFENCKISQDQILGQEGMGFTIAMSGLDRGRITIGAVATGLAEIALQKAVHYANERQQFKQPIYEFQGLQFMLAQDATELEAAKLLVQNAARCFDHQQPNAMLASMAKMKATDTAMQITTNAVQVFGGVGYTTELGIERYMRDAKVLQIVEGTNQIQKIIIARELKKKWS